MAGRKKRIVNITGWGILLLAGGILVFLFLASRKIPERIRENLREFVSDQSKGTYTLEIEAIKSRFFPFGVTLTGIDLQSVRFPQETPEEVEKTVYAFTAEKILFQDINLKSLITQSIFSSRQIKIVKPAFKLGGNELLRKKSLSQTENIITEARPLFKNLLRGIAIQNIIFEDARFTFFNDTTQISEADHVALEIRGFRTDSAMIFRKRDFFETDDILVKINNYRIHMGDSLHVTTIDTLEYSLKKNDIRARGFHLLPLEMDKNKNLYDVYVPEVYVKSKSITRFSLKDSLKISALEFIQPRIRFFHKINPDRLDLEELSDFDLYTLVQNQFTKMEIDSFFLFGAEMDIFLQPEYEEYQQHFQSIDVTLHGFSLDSASARNPDKLLHSDDIAMKVSGYHLRLEDDQHEFRADSLFVSTFTNQLGARKISISPVDSPTHKTRTEVNITCESLHIGEVDLLSLYHTRTLPTSKIGISSPEVHLQYHMGRGKNIRQKETDLLFELVSDYLRGVYANLVFIENGKLNIQNRENQELEGFFETGFSISLTNFSLDSASIERTDKFFYASHFDLQFSDYQMQLVDNLHKLKVDKIFVSSMDRHININNLKLQPVYENATEQTIKQFNRSELYNISVPAISLHGIDLHKAFFRNELSIEDFTISNPDIYFENFGTLRTKQSKIDFSEFYELIINYTDDIAVEHFTIPDGKLTWVNHSRKGKTISFDNAFKASLVNFRLNEQELNKERLFFSDDFDITILDQQFELSDSVHILKTGEIRLSSLNSTVGIKNALLFPLITSKKYSGLPTTFQVAVPELKIEGLDFQNAWYSGKPVVRKLDVISPKFQIYSQKGKTKSLDLNKYRFPLPSVVKTLQIEDLQIKDAKVITYQNQGTKQHAKANFNFSMNMPMVLLKNDLHNHLSLSNSNLILNLNDFRAPMGPNHNFSFTRLDFNKEEQTIRIDTLKVDPFLPGPGKNMFRILAPEISLSSFELNEALNQNKFIFDEINIKNPSVTIDINERITQDTLEFLKTLDLYPYVEPLLDQIRVNSLNLENAGLNVNWLTRELFRNKINLVFKDILIADNQPPSNLLNSKEFEIWTTGLTTESKNGLYAFTADTLRYNSARHRVLFSNLGILPLLEKERYPKIKGFQTDVLEARIDYAEISGIDERKWLQENILSAPVFKTGPAEVSVFRNMRYPRDPNQKPPWPQDLIKDIKQPFVFDSVILMPSKIRYSERLSISDQPGFVIFNDLTFRAGPVSNMESFLKRNNSLVINARARLYDHSEISVRFSFDMTSPEYAHTVTGSLRPMPLTPINNMLEEAEPLSIEKGQLDRFDFELSLNDKRSAGELFMSYDDLNIAVMEYSNREMKKSGFASFWANTMVLKSQTSQKETPEPVRISYPRDENRSVINYWWKSIYSGVKKVLGIDKN